MKKLNYDFCIECREVSPYEIKKEKRNITIKDKDYLMEVSVAYCLNCKEEISVPGLMDLRMKEIDEQYRNYEDLLSVSDIDKLLKIYNIGKAPLSLALGFGEITVTRYLLGQIPSKEYSDIMKKALHYPSFMIDKLEENKDKIGDTAYKKAMHAAEGLKKIFNVSDKMLSVISYIFERTYEITPLALQKILYYVQGIHMVLFDTPLYEEDCCAWVHGPVYESVFKIFKDFKYNPIDDHRFIVLKDRFLSLSKEEKKVIDLVINSFGMYSGKVLEKLTHNETPWMKAREGYLPLEYSKEIINKDDIKSYFMKIGNQYNLNDVNELKEYINDQIKMVW